MAFTILTELCNHHHNVIGAGNIERPVELAAGKTQVQILVSATDKRCDLGPNFLNSWRLCFS